MAEQKKRRYRQFAGFPGASGVIEEAAHGPKPVKPLTEAEKAEMARLGIPHDPQLPPPYTPPLDPSSRKIGIELIGPLALAAIVLFIFTWLLSVPASGERRYYSDVLSGKETHTQTEGVAAGETGQAQ